MRSKHVSFEIKRDNPNILEICNFEDWHYGFGSGSLRDLRKATKTWKKSDPSSEYWVEDEVPSHIFNSKIIKYSATKKIKKYQNL